LQGEDVEFEMEIPYAHAGRRFMRVNYTSDRDSDGRVIGWVATLSDLTEHKLAEEALREADRRKDEFLATLAHELRNPLAPVRNAVHILRLKGASDAELALARDVIDRQVKQMTRLIDDLMDVSRITRNRMDLRRERVELSEVVRAAVETSRALIEGSDHALSVDLPAEPVHLVADTVRLAQVFSNLLNNAAKYSDSGTRIALRAERQGDEVAVSIRDEGIGIPREMLPKIFEMFTQVDRSLERTHGGLGIGLTLVKRLVEMHGGSVEAQSDGPGKGSEFIVRLPAPRSAPAAPAARKAPAASDETRFAAPARRRVLVVDDNEDSATSLGAMLGILGYETRTVCESEAALALVAEFRPHVVFLDLGMPRLNGYDLARMIRRQPRGQHIALIAITGWGQAEDRRRTIDAGFDQHLVKPADPTAVARMLSVLAGR
jgi:signal transduction histidine kinase/CheY-like chemotaxis protein